VDQPDDTTEEIMETLRSSVTPDGQRVFLVFDEDKSQYRLATRWIWLAGFDSVWDACDAFEALEMMEGDLRASSKEIKTEIARIPRHHFGFLRNKATRISHLVTCAEKRINGLRPLSCGSKGSVTKWIPV